MEDSAKSLNTYSVGDTNANKFAPKLIAAVLVPRPKLYCPII